MKILSADEIFGALKKIDPKINLPTPEQVKIIEAPLAPAVVVAGAGSGKTETMSARVLYLVTNRLVRPEQVIGLTFTRKAAGELLVRVRTRLRQLEKSGLIKERLGIAEPTILTYHSYASRIVTEYGLRDGIEPDLIPLGEAATWQLAHEVVCHHIDMPEWVQKSAGSVTEDVIDLARLIAEHGTSIEAVQELTQEMIEHLQSIEGKSTIKNQELIDIARLRLAELPIVARFNEVRRERNLFTFDDQMSVAASMASQHKDVVELERSKFQAVLLDEYQDTSQSQLRLLSALFGDSHSVMAVGDPFQSIYGWRGASADTIETFYRYFPARAKDKEQRFPLSISWRNDLKVLDLANDTIDVINAKQGSIHPVKRLGQRDDAGDGEVLAGAYLTREDEADAIAEYFAKRLDEKSSAAVLVRARSQVDRIEAAIRHRGLPVEVVGVGGLLYVPEIVEIVSLLKAIAFTDRGASLARLLAGDRYCIGSKDLAALGRYARAITLEHNKGVKNPLVREITSLDSEIVENDGQFEVNIIEALDEIDAAPASYFTAAGRDRLRRASQDLARVRARSGSLIDIIMEAMRTLNVEVEVLVRDGVLEGTRHLNRFLDEASKFQSQGGTLTGFLDWIDQAKKSERGLKESEVKVSKGVVQIITVHGAKGLEWDYLAVPGLREKNFPLTGKQLENWIADSGDIPFSLRGDATQLPKFHFDGISNQKELTKAREDFAEACRARGYLEELRLGYVAFTRAKRSLFASFSFFQDGIDPMNPSALFELLIPRAEFITEVSLDLPTIENPAITNPARATWPVDSWGDRRAHFDEGVRLVESASVLSEEVLAEIDDDLLKLLKSEDVRGRKRHVYLPDRISVSALDLIFRDRTEAAKTFRRPMPTHTNIYARRGTEFHSWLERHLNVPQLPDVPEYGYAESLDDLKLEALKQAWLTSEWARRTPFDVELPFEIIIEGTLLRGRMDAIYFDGERYEIVDWKTGEVKSGSELADAAVQLAAYRIAFSRIHNVPAESISAAFHYVGANQSVRPADLLSETEIIQLLPRWDDGR